MFTRCSSPDCLKIESACPASATVEDTLLALSLAEETPLVSQEEEVSGSVLAEETQLNSEDEDDDSDDNKSVTWEELIKRSQKSLPDIYSLRSITTRMISLMYNNATQQQCAFTTMTNPPRGKSSSYCTRTLDKQDNSPILQNQMEKRVLFAPENDQNIGKTRQLSHTTESDEQESFVRS